MAKAIRALAALWPRTWSPSDGPSARPFRHHDWRLALTQPPFGTSRSIYLVKPAFARSMRTLDVCSSPSRYEQLGARRLEPAVKSRNQANGAVVSIASVHLQRQFPP